MREEDGIIIYGFLKRLSNEGELMLNDLDVDFSGSPQFMRIVDFMKSNGFIKSKGSEYNARNYVYIMPNGESVLKFNSWNEYNEYLVKEANKLIQEKKEEKESEKRIRELTEEKLIYEKTIRGLEEELKISSLLKNWWWIIAAAIGLGVYLRGFLF
ncbi:hypothetical protein [uncultured Formosa sp.]|uniref:hypothetical protein n=1 Tax=uncultured Formosa sp. TaxID=255435 RepID=UPI00262D4D86|nr:hypothetical protein [uncultured Formosa sp.]